MTAPGQATHNNPFNRTDSPIQPVGLVQNADTGVLECHVATGSKELFNLGGKTLTRNLICHLAGGVVWLTDHFPRAQSPVQVRGFRRGIWVESYTPFAVDFDLRLAERFLLKACHDRGIVVIERVTVFDLAGSLVWPSHRAWSGRPQQAQQAITAAQ